MPAIMLGTTFAMIELDAILGALRKEMNGQGPQRDTLPHGEARGFAIFRRRQRYYHQTLQLGSRAQTFTE